MRRIIRYLYYERWAVEHIKEGLLQTEAGEFASDEEIERVFNKYRAHA